MVFAELMVQRSWLWLLLECVLMAGLSWLPWLLSCTTGVQPHPARVQSVWLRPGEAINNTLHKHPPHIPNTKLRLGRIPSLAYPPQSPIQADRKKKTHTGLSTGLPYLQKKQTLSRVAIPKQKINTTPQPHYLHTSPVSHANPPPPPPSWRPEAWGCCYSWRRCLWASWLQGLAGWARRRADSWAAEVASRRAWNSPYRYPPPPGRRGMIPSPISSWSMGPWAPGPLAEGWLAWAAPGWIRGRLATGCCRWR